LALFLAIILFEPFKSSRISKVFNSFIYLPNALSPFMLGILFSMIFDPVGGLFVKINPSFTGFMYPDYLAWTLSGIETWRSLGFPLITMLAGLTAIPVEILESATLDGATGFNRVRHVIFPMIKPVVTILITLSLLGSFAVFDIFVGLVGTNAPPTKQVIASYIFHAAFQSTRGMGVASAMSTLLLLIQSVVCIIYLNRLGLIGGKPKA
jgi:ABC-type sugar transport system permease subunit